MSNATSGGELGFSYMGGKSSYLLMKGTCMSVNEDITEIPLNARFVRRKTASMRVKCYSTKSIEQKCPCHFILS